MKRLTKSGGSYCDNCSTIKDEFCSCDDENAMYKKLSEYEDTGLEPNKMPKWISVKDRLPDAPGEYMVAFHPCYWDNVKYGVIKVGLDSFRGKTTWAKKKYQRVIYWMPLPEPPKEEE